MSLFAAAKIALNFTIFCSLDRVLSDLTAFISTRAFSQIGLIKVSCCSDKPSCFNMRPFILPWCPPHLPFIPSLLFVSAGFVCGTELETMLAVANAPIVIMLESARPSV